MNGRSSVRSRGVEKFAIVIHQETIGGFRAEVPALPGCYSQDETIEDLKAHVREAIEGVLGVRGAQGKQPERNIQIPDLKPGERKIIGPAASLRL